MKKLSILLTCLFSISSYSQEACNYNHCEEMGEPVEVCFVRRATYNSSNHLGIPVTAHMRGLCDGAPMTLVSSASGVRNKLKEIKRSCRKISRIVFAGHGSNRGHEAMFARFNEVNREYRNLSCVMDNRSRIYMNGCNTGSSCTGQILLHNVARTFLAEGGGYVSGHTNYAIGFPWTDAASINFTDRVVKFMPEHGDHATVYLTGIGALGLMESDACRSDIDEIVDNLRDLLDDAPDSCVDNRVSLQNHLAYLIEIRDWYDRTEGDINQLGRRTQLTYFASVINWVEAQGNNITACIRQQNQQQTPYGYGVLTDFGSLNNQQ